MGARAWAIAALAAAAASASESGAPVTPTLERATVLVHKALEGVAGSGGVLVVGKPGLITYFVMNLGSTTAYEVAVRDEYPPASFDVVEGSGSASFATLEP